MKTAFLITARLKSTRLTMKLLREVEGRPILAHMLDRVKQARRVDEIVICTSTNPQDDPLETLAAAEGVSCFRGAEDDVLARLAGAANAYAADYILNITGDCPFVDPVYADRIVDAYEKTGADFIRAFDLPHGAFSYGIKPAALRQIVELKDTEETDSFGRYFTDTGMFEVHDLAVDERHRRPSLRMTLDYPEDLEFFRAVFAALYRRGSVFTLDEILDYVDRHPEVERINRHRGADYAARFARQTAIRLKPRFAVNRAAIVGAGSIGQRHIRNLRTLGVTDIVALRTRRGHTQALDASLGVREVGGWRELASEAPDVAIVANPTSHHLEAAIQLAPVVRGLFIEKPVAASLAEARQICHAVRTHRVVSFVGHVLQFHPVVRALDRAMFDATYGSPLALQAQAGQWLPDWHPEEDYRRSFAARADLGGGVVRTLMHELHLAIQLLGAPRTVSCVTARSPQLDIDVESAADLTIRHASGAVSQLHLDYLQRPPSRFGALICERGALRYDLATPRVAAVGKRGATTLFEGPVDFNDCYVDELRTFLRYVREGQVRHEHDVEHALPAIAAIDAAFASHAQQRIVAV